MPITKEQLQNYLSTGEFWDIVKDHAVDFYLIDDSMTQLCANDLKRFDITTSSFFTYTGIQIALDDVNYIKIY